MFKLFVSEPCVRRCRHIETQSNHALTGAYVSNQSTNGGVRQQWYHLVDLYHVCSNYAPGAKNDPSSGSHVLHRFIKG